LVPNSGIGYIGMSDCLKFLKRDQEAENSYSKAIEIMQKSPIDDP
jgi:hypothetical protein